MYRLGCRIPITHQNTDSHPMRFGSLHWWSRSLHWTSSGHDREFLMHMLQFYLECCRCLYLTPFITIGADNHSSSITLLRSVWTLPDRVQRHQGEGRLNAFLGH